MKENESREMYLKAICELEQQNSVVRIVDIAARMGFFQASVSRASMCSEKTAISPIHRTGMSR
jgi:Mn-dependent DtxR family transcriptional regulator